MSKHPERGLRLSARPHIYPAPQHVDACPPWWMRSQAILALLGGGSMQDPASGLLRINLPRTPVNKKGGRAGILAAPAPLLNLSLL